jgi:Fic family protein
LHLKNNYVYVPYSSLESVIEQSKEGYYLSLRQTQRTIRSDNPNWQPWVLFFIRALHRQKQRLEGEIELEKSLMGELPDLSMKILELMRSWGRVTVKEIVATTHANRNTIKKHLEALVEKNYLQQNGIGKGTWYSGK